MTHDIQNPFSGKYRARFQENELFGTTLAGTNNVFVFANFIRNFTAQESILDPPVGLYLWSANGEQDLECRTTARPHSLLCKLIKDFDHMLLGV